MDRSIVHEFAHVFAWKSHARWEFASSQAADMRSHYLTVHVLSGRFATHIKDITRDWEPTLGVSNSVAGLSSCG